MGIRVSRKTVVLLAVGAACLLVFDHATVPFSQPKFCVSCHEMEKPHASWQKSSHFVNRTGVQVTCIECHLPHKDDRIAHLVSRFWAGAKDLSVSLLGRYDAEEEANADCARCIAAGHYRDARVEPIPLAATPAGPPACA